MPVPVPVPIICAGIPKNATNTILVGYRGPSALLVVQSIGGLDVIKDFLNISFDCVIYILNYLANYFSFKHKKAEVNRSEGRCKIEFRSKPLDLQMAVD